MTSRLTSPVPIAVIGSACRLPGADDPASFWQLILDGGTRTQPLPASRLDRSLLFDPRKGVPHRTYADIGCLIDYDRLGPAAAYLRPEITRHPEPLHVKLAEVTAEAFVSAGLHPLDLPTRRAGVYVGHTRSGGLAGDLVYGTMIERIAGSLASSATLTGLLGRRTESVTGRLIESVRSQQPSFDGPVPDLASSMAARIVAAAFDLDGPAMVFNSACASSSQAIVQAIRALSLGRIDVAVAAGASYLHSDTLVLFSQAQSLSSSGSRPWDAEADGLVVGEGCVSLVLKRLDRAVADRDPIQGVLVGSSISSDGRGKSLWAPGKNGQIAAVRRAYRTEDDLRAVQYLEAHATSTQLGDATEMEALAEAVGPVLTPGTRIPVGSVKANVGHTLECAGITSVLKVLLALQNQTIPPVTHVQTPNPKIDWATVPFYLPRQAETWTRTDRPRRAAVNAFGIGGLNTHLVIEEAPAERQAGIRATGFGRGSIGRAAIRPGQGEGPATRSDAGSSPSAGSDGNRPTTTVPVAIVGRGAVLPGARTFAALPDLIASGRDATTPVPTERWGASWPPQDGVVRQGGFVPRAGVVTDFAYDWRRHKVPPKQIEQASPLQFMILDAVDQAVAEAGLVAASEGTAPAGGSWNKERTGVIVGTVFGGDFATRLQVGLRLPELRRTLATLVGEELTAAQAVTEGRLASTLNSILDEFQADILARMPAVLDETGSFTASTLASRVTKSFDLGGGAVALDAGVGSSLAAVACCVDQLASGDNDIMVCVAAEQDLTLAQFEGWAKSGRLAEKAVPREGNRSEANPAHAETGLVPGEGCVVLILRRLDDAVRDGQPILGVIQAVTAASGRPDQAALSAAKRSHNAVGVTSNVVDHVEVVPSGVTWLDGADRQGLGMTYTGPGMPEGSSRSRTKGSNVVSSTEALSPEHPTTASGPTVAAFVRQIGHTGAAAGLASTLKATVLLGSERSTEGRDSDGRSSGPGDEPPDTDVVAIHTTGPNESAWHLLLSKGSTMTDRTVPSWPESHTAPLRQASDRPMASGVGEDSPLTVLAGGILHFDATFARRDAKRRQAGSTEAQVLSASRPVVAASVANPSVSAKRAMPGPIDPVTANPMAANSLTAQPMTRDGVASPAVTANMSSGIGARDEALPMPAIRATTAPPNPISYGWTFGASSPPAPTMPTPPVAPTVAQPAMTARPTPSAPPIPHSFATAAPVAPAPVPVASAPRQPSSLPAPQPKVDTSRLETFLVNFVVEQTGYPAEIVDLDADLEGDLGIDSIKKAQLFGELREFFDVTPRADMSLDDFPTLRHVMDFLIAEAPESAGDAPATGADFATSLTGAVGMATPNGSASGTMLTLAEPIAAFAPPPAAWSPATSGGTVVMASKPVSTTGADTSRLETFLVNFVVEQTGYPAEIVDLDADLEGDLGIDSIKKAQLFGELREFFDVTPRADMSLDDFPTLRHVMDFLIAETVG